MWKTSRKFLLVTLGGVVAIGLAACGSGSSNAAPSSNISGPSAVSPTAAPATTASVSTAAASPDTDSTAPTTASVASGSATIGAPCLESQLKASTTDVILNSAGQRGVRLLFLNTSTQTCTLTGYPGAAITDSSGRQVEQATRTLRGPLGGMPAGATTYTAVTLAPGVSAQAELEGVDIQQPGAAQAGCDAPPNPGILVTPPNTTIPVPFTVSWPICESFEIHPVRPVA